MDLRPVRDEKESFRFNLICQKCDILGNTFRLSETT